MEVDQEAPTVVRAYNVAGVSSICGNSGCLKIITSEKATCSYSNKNCNFAIADGEKMPYDKSEEHYAEWKTDITYHIRCADEAGNEPVSNQCSITVKLYEVI